MIETGRPFRRRALIPAPGGARQPLGGRARFFMEF